MSAPYLILSDLHFHAWNAFSHLTDTGINSRLLIIIQEVEAAAERLRTAGGHLIVLAGDVFHVRGELHTSVLNPVLDLFDRLRDQGHRVIAIPGNHDLETKQSARVGNALTTLEQHGVEVCHEPTFYEVARLYLIPWQESIEQLLQHAREMPHSVAGARFDVDLIIHAPVDGVLLNIPSHGLTPDILGALGFRYVMAGHYHQHKDFGNGVYSIGALTHQKWNDVGSTAGYLIVTSEEVRHYETAAPKFLDFGNTDFTASQVRGNYVRLWAELTAEDEALARQRLVEGGAASFIIEPLLRAVEGRTREVEVAAEGTPTEAIIADFVNDKRYEHQEELLLLCQELLDEVRAVDS